MTRTTKAQRRALFAKWQQATQAQAEKGRKFLTYRQFRKGVQPMICDTGIVVQWCGMWLAIEADGYTHS